MRPNVVIAGGTEGDTWLHARAYTARFDKTLDDASKSGPSDTLPTPVSVEFVGVWAGNETRNRAQCLSLKPYRRFEDVLDDPAVMFIELIAPTPDRTRKAIAAIKAGKHVLLGAPFARTHAEARILEEAARGSNLGLMSHDPWRFYPPYQRVEAAVRQEMVGRIQTIRMRTVLAGHGGWDRYLNPGFPGDRTPTLPHGEVLFWEEAFLKLSLAVRLFGPIEELFFSGTLPDPGGSACVLTFKHRTHATYGSLEFVVSPGLTIRSPYAAEAHRIELTGTAGVIWLNGGPGRIRAEPTLSIYRGKNLVAYENLPDEWELGFRGCARHFAELALSGKRDHDGLTTARHVVACLESLKTTDTLADETRHCVQAE